MICRHCCAKLTNIFADLNYSPISNEMLSRRQLEEPEKYYPLKVYVCEKCFLVQVDEIKKTAAIFDEKYTYYSSFSTSWLAHVENYVDMMMNRFDLNDSSQVIEIASNDGYLLQYFKKYNIPVLGIDPTANTAIEAEKKGIQTIVDFFSSKFAQNRLLPEGIKADLIIGNNVLAHVPNINDFVKGMKMILKRKGIITMEFPHLLKLVMQSQFDTIYHEHFSYLSLYTVNRIFRAVGLSIFDVEKISTHGGSLRIFATNDSDDSTYISSRVTALIEKEIDSGICSLEFYNNFQSKIDIIKYDIWSFLIEQKLNNKKVIGYGAAAKGNTLFNYCGIKGTDLIRFVVDASPYKQQKFLPGSHIPVVNKNQIEKYKPDYIIIIPWNLKEEISHQLSYIKNWGGKFVIFIPELKVF